ncbi:MAG: lysylphosphatidylglycerol synthase domain-containing protein [Planctomycetaceae bacterium]|nr:lysylphosphatidylglycerol synthase domain-containing protein [Planctomycetaceae bacterium]
MSKKTRQKQMRKERLKKNNTSPRKIIFAVLRWLMIILVLVWVAREIYKTGTDMANYRWEPRFGWILISATAYLIAYIPAWCYWHIILRRLGQHPTVYASIRAYYIGHLGKYMPGKAMVVTLRAGMVRSDRVKTSVAVASVFLETLTMMAVGAMISAVLLFVFFREQKFLMLVSVSLMLVSGLPVVPFFFKLVVKIAGAIKNDAAMNDALNRFDAKTLLCGWGLMCVTWFFLGVSLWATIKGVGISSEDFWQHIPRFVAATALSTVAGFLSMIPGGMGVREMVLSELMNRYFQIVVLPTGLTPKVAGLVVAGVSRLVMIFSELAVSALLFFQFFGRKQ